MLGLEVFLIGCGMYALAGVLFAVAFVARGVSRVDPAAAGAPLTFRILIVPGTAALWPVMSLKWLRASGSGAEAHT